MVLSAIRRKDFRWFKMNVGPLGDQGSEHPGRRRIFENLE